MASHNTIRTVAFVGAAVSALAYVGFALGGLNGDAWWHANKVWATAAFAPRHVLLAWAVFIAIGVAAYVFRGRLRDRLIAVATTLVGLPLGWATLLWLFYYNQPAGVWPGFHDEVWRWVVNHIYAEIAVALLIGFLGLAAVTQAKRDQ